MKLHIVGMTEVVDGETVYIACNALLDRGSEVTWILDSIAARNNFKIIGVVDLILSTINGSVKPEVFKYEVIFKNEAYPTNPIVLFALGLDTLGS